MITALLFKILNAVLGISLQLKLVLEDLRKLKIAVVDLKKDVDQILELLVPGPTVKCTVTIYFPDGSIIQGATHMQLRDNQQVTFSLSPVDAKGNPSALDPTKTVLTADNPALVSIEVNPDGLGGTIKALGPIGSTQITGSVGDDPSDGSDGGTILLDALTVDVIAGDTATVTINTGEPTNQ